MNHSPSLNSLIIVYPYHKMVFPQPHVYMTRAVEEKINLNIYTGFLRSSFAYSAFLNVKYSDIKPYDMQTMSQTLFVRLVYCLHLQFLLRFLVNERMSYKLSDEGIYTQNVHIVSTRSRPSEEENHAR